MVIRSQVHDIVERFRDYPVMGVHAKKLAWKRLGSADALMADHDIVHATTKAVDSCNEHVPGSSPGQGAIIDAQTNLKLRPSVLA